MIPIKPAMSRFKLNQPCRDTYLKSECHDPHWTSHVTIPTKPTMSRSPLNQPCHDPGWVIACLWLQIIVRVNLNQMFGRSNQGLIPQSIHTQYIPLLRRHAFTVKLTTNIEHFSPLLWEFGGCWLGRLSEQQRVPATWPRYNDRVGRRAYERPSPCYPNPLAKNSDFFVTYVFWKRPLVASFVDFFL